MFPSPLIELAKLAFWPRCVEPPLALLEEEREAVTWDAVEATHMTLRLVPEVLDAIDVVLVLGEGVGMVDPEVLEVRDVGTVANRPPEVG